MRFKADKHSNYDDFDDEYFELDEETIQQIDEEYEDFDYYDESAGKPKRLRKFIIWLVFLCIIVIAINIGALFFTGKLWFNQPEKTDYPIRGALVDSDLGKINWNTFSKQNLSFAYIKATKGTAFKGKNFDEYWTDSKDCELITGAYHIFSLTKDGEKQAKHFCEAIGDSVIGRLVPAVEVKLSGLYAIIPPEKSEVVKNLTDFCNYIKTEYGVYPIIICNERSYEEYLSSDFNKYKFMMKSYFSEPDEDVAQDFWCYNPRVRVNGYENTKKYFTMFVYNQTVDIDTFKKEFVC